MILDIHLVNVIFDIMKAHSPKKEHNEIAEAYVAILDDYGYADSLRMETDLEPEMKKAMARYFVDDISIDDDGEIIDDDDDLDSMILDGDFDNDY